MGAEANTPAPHDMREYTHFKLIGFKKKHTITGSKERRCGFIEYQAEKVKGEMESFNYSTIKQVYQNKLGPAAQHLLNIH